MSLQFRHGFLTQQPTPKHPFPSTNRIHVSSQAGTTSTASTASLRYKAMEIHVALSRGASRPKKAEIVSFSVHFLGICSGKTWKNRTN